MKSIALSLAFVSAVTAQRTFTLYTSAGGRPSQTTGWAQNAFASVTFSVPGNWNGRIWVTIMFSCLYKVNSIGSRAAGTATSRPTPAPNSCLDGGCNGGLVCDPVTGTGVPPASLAEFNLGSGGTDSMTSISVSLVDGYNLPCVCAVDLGPNCPAPLIGPFDSDGSACLVDALNGNAGNSPNCCSGSYDTPQTCPSSGVAYYSYFKSNCPKAYAYAYDDLTSLFTCPASANAGYTISFCPAS
ncbi:thaumatin [Mycena haematopus]|nr:thaumatin [Mycena haematopus]